MTTTFTIPTELQTIDRECYPTNPLTPGQWRKALAGEDWLCVSVTEKEGGGRRRAYLVAQVVSEGGYYCTKLKRLGVSGVDRGKGLAKELLKSVTLYPCEAELREDNLPGLKLLTGAGFGVVGLDRGRFGDRDGVLLWRAKGEVHSGD